MSTTSRYATPRSFIHRSDARLKIGFLLAISLIIFGAGPGILLYVALFIILLFFWSGAGVRGAVLSLKPALPIFFAIVVMHTIGIGNGEWGFPSLTTALAGLLKGALLVARFSLLIMASTILTRTSSPLEIAAALEALLSPLKVLRLPINALAQALSLAIRFLPLLLLELQDIREAQKTRGMDMRSASIKRKSHLARLTILALLNNTIARVDAISDAMAARGYNSASERTHLHPLRMQKSDYWLMLFMLVAVIVLFVARTI